MTELVLADVGRIRLEQLFNEVKIILVCSTDEEAVLTLRAIADMLQRSVATLTFRQPDALS